VLAQIGDSTNLKLHIDTGSNLINTLSSLCSNCSLATDLGPTWDLSGGVDQLSSTTYYSDDGSGPGATGEIYSGTISLPGGMPSMSAGIFAVTELMASTGVAYTGASGQSTDYPNGASGRIGMAGDSGSDKNSRNFVEALSSIGLQQIFALELCRSYGNLWLGGYSTSVMSGSVQWTPMVTPQAKMEVALSDLQVGGVSLGYSTTDFQSSLGKSPTVDSGTPHLELPDAIFTALDDYLNNNTQLATLLSVDGDFFTNGACVSAGSLTMDQIDAALPSLNFVFPTSSGSSFTLTAPASRSYLFFEPAAEGGYICPGISDNGTSGTILGDTALFNSHVIVFDQVNSRIGFALDSGCDNSY
jgi:hypothetical protein